MYNQLVDIGKDGNVLLQDSSIALMPSMWCLYKDRKGGSKQVRWIVAMYDYKSPYRRLPEDERHSRVSYMIFEKSKNPKFNSKLVKDAIEEYKKLQYDPLIDEYNAMCEKSYQMTKVYRSIKPTAETLEDLNKMQEQMGKAAIARDKIKALILKNEESEVKISGTGSEDFSLFEQDERLIDND
jgi:hypothetical protein